LIDMNMTRFEGIKASPGIAIGPVYLYDPGEFWVDPSRVNADAVAAEEARFRGALSEVAEELKATRLHVEETLGTDYAQIFDAHLLILQDHALVGPTLARIRDDRYNAEYAFWATCRHLHRQFEAIQDEYLRDRGSADLLGIEKRVLARLCRHERVRIDHLPHEAIVIAHDLMPADTAHMQPDQVLGLVTEVGGPTSHTVILARGLEIPAVVSVSDIMVKARSGDLAIVDGRRGRVIFNPDEHTLDRYRKLAQRYKERKAGLADTRDLPAETTDGVRVSLQANVEVPAEVDSVIAYGAEGIGLYRTEYLYLAQNTLPDEETQVAAYSQMAERIAPQPLVIRTLDLGGDKMSHLLNTVPEMNPFLGWRSIRLTLGHRDLFKVQLRAIFRASAVGNVRIMLPLISGIEELREALSVLDEVREELVQEGIPFDANCPVGAMIEVPSAALVADHLAREVDFFSIGTNDLIQYTLAVDRGNDLVAYLFEPLHPAVLRLIKGVIDAAHAQDISVTVCGEMAGDLRSSLLLVGLGVDGLSMTPSGLPEVKRVIRDVSFDRLQAIAEDVLDMHVLEDIHNRVNEGLRDVVGDVVVDEAVEEEV
jgi:phosphotransferase system enzyme I (PtsI)